MKKILGFSFLLLFLVLAGKFYWQNLRGVGPALSKPAADIAKLLESNPGENSTGIPLKLPPGFSISIYAKDLQAPRVLTQDSAGNILVSLPQSGRVVSLPSAAIIADNLNQPHGLAFANGKLFIAQTNQVTAYDYNPSTLKATNKSKILNLPDGGNHVTRTILVSDNQLLISIGSSCNICLEKDDRRASILTSDLDGNNVRHYADGLRNSVFMIEHPKTKQIWATEMGRDLIGDDIPPDEINIVEAGKDYGWPYCYGQQVVDPFNNNQKDCSTTQPSFVDLQAHSAPLGLTFVPDSWPEEYKHDLLVAFHGSWNRTAPTGYKIVRIPLDENGKVEGETQDFITGWINDKNEVLGRPVDLFARPDGYLLISDDKAGVIYLLQYNR